MTNSLGVFLRTSKVTGMGSIKVEKEGPTKTSEGLIVGRYLKRH